MLWRMSLQTLGSASAFDITPVSRRARSSPTRGGSTIPRQVTRRSLQVDWHCVRNNVKLNGSDRRDVVLLCSHSCRAFLFTSTGGPKPSSETRTPPPHEWRRASGPMVSIAPARSDRANRHPFFARFHRCASRCPCCSPHVLRLRGAG